MDNSRHMNQQACAPAVIRGSSSHTNLSSTQLIEPPIPHGPGVRLPINLGLGLGLIEDVLQPQGLIVAARSVAPPRAAMRPATISTMPVVAKVPIAPKPPIHATCPGRRGGTSQRPPPTRGAAHAGGACTMRAARHTEARHAADRTCMRA